MKKKLAALAMAATMALSCSTGAFAEEEIQTTYGEKKFDNVTIRVEVFDRSNAPEGSTVVDNKWVDYINQEMNKVGISVEFVAVPRSEEQSKIQVMMASGTAPDVIMTYDRSLAEDYYNKGGLVVLNDFVDGENQAVNLKNYLTEEVIDMCRTEDGELWGLTARRATTYKSNVFLRKDWLDKLGMETPDTVDEFYDVLKAFKEKNPDGKENVIACLPDGIGWSNVTIMAEAFMESALDETQFNISAFCPVYSDDGYVEYLRFLNRLYNEGLMDQEYYTRTSINEVLVNGRTGCFEWTFNNNVDVLQGNVLRLLRSTEPDADIISIPPLQNVNDGQQYGLADAKNGAYLMIPKTCKNVDAVITYLDWMATEDGGFVIYNGFEGEHYELEDGVAMPIDTAYNDTDKNWINSDLFLIGNQGYFSDLDSAMKARAAETPDYTDHVEENFKNAGTGIIRSVPSYTSPAQYANYTEITLAMEEYQVKCITCSTDEFDSCIEEYRNALQKAGMDQVVEERTAYFTGNAQ